MGTGDERRAYGTMCGPFQTERLRREREGRIAPFVARGSWREREREKEGRRSRNAMGSTAKELDDDEDEDEDVDGRKMELPSSRRMNNFIPKLCTPSKKKLEPFSKRSAPPI